MRTLFCLSALANVALIGALFWMHRSAESDLQKMLEATWHAEETHMRVHSLALEAIEDPDSASGGEVERVLRHYVEAWELNNDKRDLFLQALR